MIDDRRSLPELIPQVIHRILMGAINPIKIRIHG